MKIDIAMIQETHWGNNGEWEQGEYTFYVTAARRNGTENTKESIQGGKGIGGLAIAIKKDIKENILQIARINERIMKIRLETNIHGGKITILNTYAPHMSYNAGEREEYWKKIGETLKEANRKDCIIWGTDNNGQVAQENKDKKEKNKCVGRRTMAKNRKRKWN